MYEPRGYVECFFRPVFSNSEVCRHTHTLCEFDLISLHFVYLTSIPTSGTACCCSATPAWKVCVRIVWLLFSSWFIVFAIWSCVAVISVVWFCVQLVGLLCAFSVYACCLLVWCPLDFWGDCCLVCLMVGSFCLLARCGMRSRMHGFRTMHSTETSVHTAHSDTLHTAHSVGYTPKHCCTQWQLHT